MGAIPVNHLVALESAFDERAGENHFPGGRNESETQGLVGKRERDGGALIDPEGPSVLGACEGQSIPPVLHA